MADQTNNKLLRIELIFSSALEEDIFSGFVQAGIGKKYTKIPSVLGAGCSNPKQGDAIWPQFNTVIIIYCDKEEAEKIVSVVEHVRSLYPAEGVACFESSAKMY
jgi:hypothetical protein